MLKTFRPLAGIMALFTAMFSPQVSAQQPAEPIVRPALWKVADTDTTIYLFGTVHALPPGIPWYQGEIATAFEGSSELVTEIIEEDHGAAQKVIMATAILPAGKTLRGMMSAEDKLKYEAALARVGMPPTAFDQIEPWFVAITLAVVQLQKDGLLSQNGVESGLNARAKASGQEQGALETVAYQLGLFDALPVDVQKQFLMDVVESLPTATADLVRIIDAWKAGDVEQLGQLMQEQTNNPEVLDVILYKRNAAWADWIKNRLDKPGSVFVAVGAAHLAGQQSVQDKLAGLGITATRVQ